MPTVDFSIFEVPAVVQMKLYSLNPGETIVRIHHDLYERDNKNLMQIARLQSEIRPLVEWFALNGWVVYKSTNDCSYLLHQSGVGRVWHRVRNGDFVEHENGLIYSVESDDSERKVFGMVVVFSSMADPHDASGLSRYFYRNYSSIAKHVGPGVAILRIADIDSVVGGFYLPTNWDPLRHVKVNQLIREVANRMNVSDDNIVLYGASKGGTGALYHSLYSQAAWKCVSVDPVVDDHYYENQYRDSHWTGGAIFPHRKSELFDALIEGTRWENHVHPRISIVSSRRSPLFQSISVVAGSIPASAKIFAIVDDPKIAGHPDVSPRSVQFATGLINLGVRGVPVESGTYEI